MLGGMGFFRRLLLEFGLLLFTQSGQALDARGEAVKQGGFVFLGLGHRRYGRNRLTEVC
jgi:hypothetical protein